MKLWTVLAASAALMYAAAASPANADGADAFKKNRCAQCHTVTGKHTIGPSLKGVMGRTAGTADGFSEKRYSASMVAAGKKGLKWDAKAVDAYLLNPTQYLRDYLGDPKANTKMAFPGLKDEGQRKAIIDYLAGLK